MPTGNSTFAEREPLARPLAAPTEREKVKLEPQHYPAFDAAEVDKINWGFEFVETYYPDYNIEDPYNTKQAAGTFYDREFPVWSSTTLLLE